MWGRMVSCAPVGNRRRIAGSMGPQAGCQPAAGYQPAPQPLQKSDERELPGCKPVSVPLRAAVIPLGRALLRGSSDLPGSRTGRAVPPPLFGLAPRGVCHAGEITSAAVRSYRTISPLPRVAARRYIFCCAFRRTLRSSRPLAGTPPCGDRTFLFLTEATTRPATHRNIVAFPEPFCMGKYLITESR